MKNIFILSFLFLSVQSIAEDFVVTVVSGTVKKRHSDKVIQVGDRISDGDSLVVRTANDFLIVLGSRGRFQVSLDNKKPNKPGEFTNLVVKENIHLHAENMRLSSRAVGDEMTLAGYFLPTTVNGKEVNDKILIADELKIPIRNMGYGTVDNQEKFFFLQLIDQNKKGTNRKLIVKNDSLIISADDLVFNGKTYHSNDGTLKLGFVEGYSAQKKITEIAVIKPVVISKKYIKEMIRAVQLSLPNAAKNDILNEVYTELYFLYGKPDMHVIENLYLN